MTLCARLKTTVSMALRFKSLGIARNRADGSPLALSYRQLVVEHTATLVASPRPNVEVVAVQKRRVRAHLDRPDIRSLHH
jgi:hypothetical protein